MRKAVVLAVLGLAALVAAAQGAKPPKQQPTLSIGVRPNPIIFGASTGVFGQLSGTSNASVTITLDQAPYPHRQYTKVGTVRTNATGAYAFVGLRPGLNTSYRTRGKGATSSSILVYVRMGVSLSVSDSTPATGQRVRFSGSVSPAHNGRMVLIQRRDRSGVFRTVARALLVPSTAGRSKYGVRKRIFTNGVYRARASADADHLPGTSRTRTLAVH
jgi:hypothetical protein